MTQSYETTSPTSTNGGPAGRTQPAAETPSRHRDRVHWGPVWAGVLVALPVFLVLQLLLFSFGALDIGSGSQGTASSIVSAVVALVAFLVGGLMAGSSAASHDSDEGLLHGVVTWAVGVVAILGLTVLGAGALLGDLATVTSQLGGAGQTAGRAAGQAGAQIDPAQALSTAHQAAGWAALALGLTVVASAVGGLLGQQIGRRH